MHESDLARFDAATLLARFDAMAATITRADERKVQKFSDIKKTRRLIAPLLYLLVEIKARE